MGKLNEIPFTGPGQYCLVNKNSFLNSTFFYFLQQCQKIYIQSECDFIVEIFWGLWFN